MDSHALVDAGAERGQVSTTNRLSMAWLDLSLRTKGLIVLVVPLLAVFGGVLLAFALDRQEDQVRGEALQAAQINDALEEVQLRLTDAEAGVWGYLLSGRIELLAPTDAAATEVPQALAHLEELIQDPVQQARARELRLLVERRMAILMTTRSYGDAGGSAPFVVPTPQLSAGNAAMTAVREQIAVMQSAETEILEARIAHLDRNQEQSLASLIGTFTFGLGGGAVIALLLAKGVVDRIEQLETNANRLANGQPVLVTPPGKDEVGRLGKSLMDASRLLISREEELHATNRELEAFSYSISHDLRAPLRAVDGFSRLLLDDHASGLPAEAQRYLHLVRDRAQQMGQLIDDLLAFSRLSRTPLTARPIAPASVVQRVLNDFASDLEGRDVEIIIDDLPPCQADPALLTQVFANLLANALKYTRGREPARIEVGALPDPDVFGMQVYFVRDNGVGFDMAFADKLFGVFQRLHRAEQYEGTGVGLAIVQRIIHRHGGRIWAEAAVDQGATFFFTLPIAQIGTNASPAVQPAERVISPERAVNG